MDIRLQLNSDHFIKRVFWALVGCELSIFFLDILFNHYNLVKIGALKRLFNITREDGLANFFSSFQLIVVGIVLFLIYWASKKNKNPKSFIDEKGWLILALFFTFMGFDDATKFHERIGSTAKVLMKAGEMRTVASPSLLESFPSYTWQLVFGPFFAAMGLFILWYLWKNLYDQRSKKMFVAALVLYVLAVAMDFLEGLGTGPYQGVAESLGLLPKKVVHLSKAYEETFEMFGTTLFLICFLRHLFWLFKGSRGLELKVN